jgi:RNA polymerase sigma factor (TIGR02999 family)
VESAAPLTDLLRRARSGDQAALHAVFAAAYEDLRRLAHQRLSGGQRAPLLDTTALVHESFLRLASARRLELNDRAHFMRYAAQVMRSVIVDCVRERRSLRRGGDAHHTALTTQLVDQQVAGEEAILRVHEALEELAKLDARLAQVCEMRYFAGMTELEIAESLGITDRTVRRDWEKARLLLTEALG